MAAAALTTAASDWPGWRGPEGTGASSEKGLPLKWSAKENVRWQAALPSLQVVMLPKAGHDLWSRDQDAYLAVLRPFLDRIE